MNKFILLLALSVCSTLFSAENTEPVPYEIQMFSGGLEIPWSIIFPNEERLFALAAERPGRINMISNGQGILHSFDEVVSRSEEGLMGLELDPEYKNNHFLYVSLAYTDSSGMFVKVSRLTLDRSDPNPSKLINEKILIDKIPATHLHAGCRIKFGPDGKLYITTGDATDKYLAQDLNSLCGKTLRINSDGSIPDDNPFPNSPVWSYGHRNSQGIAWHPVTHEMYETEHGPSGFDGPGGGDEINRIVKGGNYGWPVVHHDESKDGMMDPIAVYTPAEAPGGLLIYSGKIFPQFKHNLFFACLRGEGIMRVVLDENDPDKIVSSEKLADVNFGRIRDVVEGPDGFIYFSTSNRDGRGDPADNDDRIFRIVPK